MNAPRQIIFVNRFYWPDEPATAQLLTDLAESLAASGHSVTVITTRPPEKGSNLNVCGPSSFALSETRHGVSIVRVPSSRLGKRSLLKRALDFTTFLHAARRAVATLAQPGDTLVAMTDPPMLGAAIASIARQKNLRLIHWIQDIFPEVAMALGHRALTSWLRPWRDSAWRAADTCVTLGTDMASLLRERRVPATQIHLCPNWAPAGLQPLPVSAADPLRAAWALTGKFVVAYSGNLGRVHDLAPILDVATALRDDPRIAFVFIGDGAHRPSLEATARERALTNVHFRPAQPRERLAETLALGDVHLVTLRAGCERLVFPSKLYGIAALGRPVLFVGPRDCEVARLVEHDAFGHAFSRDDIAAIAVTIRALSHDPARVAALGRAAAAFSERAGQRHHAVAFWLRLLDPTKPLARASPPPPLSPPT